MFGPARCQRGRVLETREAVAVPKERAAQTLPGDGKPGGPLGGGSVMPAWGGLTVGIASLASGV